MGDGIGWDLVAPAGAAIEDKWDTLGIGLYKFYTSESGGPYFYYNTADCRYFMIGSNTYDSTSHDIYLKYNGSTKTFSYKRFNSSEGYTLISNGDTLPIWTALDVSGPPGANCFLQSFTPANLTISYVNNNPKLTWSIEHEDTAGFYKIYRTVWENGQFSVQDVVWPPIFTVNSWIDEDFSRTKFGDYTIDYEISYLNLPPMESNLSNTASTTSGNWNGPNGKLLENDTAVSAFYLDNYPNPFNPVTTIRYTVLKQSDVRISIYDIKGQEIIVLISEVQSTGDKEFQFDASKLPSGLYFYRVKAGNIIHTRKMTVIK